MELIKQAQDDMRLGYHSRAPGVLTSAIIWAAATATIALVSVERAVWVLFIGDMLIHPVSLVICRMLGSRGGHARTNPLAQLAMGTRSGRSSLYRLPMSPTCGSRSGSSPQRC